MKIENRIKKAIKDRISRYHNIESIERIKKLPKGAFTVFLGFDGDLLFVRNYEVTLSKGGPVYCQANTLFNLFVVKIFYFEEVSGKLFERTFDKE